jgi:intracellular sulfur oxidation DsrE/DsrF family protein
MIDTPTPRLLAAALLAALQERGVRVVLCAQTAPSRGFERDQLASGVELALSAMTALVTLQAEGYALIAF